MITITARINVSENVSENGGEINSLQSNISGNNVSANINQILGKRSVTIGNPFILGKSILDSGATYADNLPYFLGSQLSDKNGNFASKYIITISGKDITQFVIAFDTTNNAFPKNIVVDGEIFYDDDPIWEINVDTANNHTIEISNWNKPYSPLTITNLYADIGIEIDKNNLIAFNSEIIDRSNIKSPSYGIISNSASLTFADLNEQALDLISQQILHSNIKIDVWLNNTVSGSQEQVCLMEIRELSYDNYNRQVQISLKDGLEAWQDINIEALNYNPLLGEAKTAKWIYEYLLLKTPSSSKMLTFEELDEDTKNILESTNIQYPLLEADTLWNQWQKLCELCLLHIYVDNNGRTVCKY